MSLRPANSSGEPFAPVAGTVRPIIDIGPHPFWHNTTIGPDNCNACGGSPNHPIHVPKTANEAPAEEIEHAGGTK